MISSKKEEKKARGTTIVLGPSRVSRPEVRAARKTCKLGHDQVAPVVMMESASAAVTRPFVSPRTGVPGDGSSAKIASLYELIRGVYCQPDWTQMKTSSSEIAPRSPS